MDKINLFENSKKPVHIHIGLRMIKTVIAVYLCSLIGCLRGEPAFFSMITALSCIQPSNDKTIVSAFNQVVGTMVGAAFGLLAVFIEMKTGLYNLLPVYYLLVSLFLIPVILSCLLMHKSSVAAFACVVFITIAVYQVGSAAQALSYAVWRTVEIFIGVLVAFLVNLILPNHLAKKSA